MSNNAPQPPPMLQVVTLMISNMAVLEKVSIDENARRTATDTIDKSVELCPQLKPMADQIRERCAHLTIAGGRS